MIQVSDLSFGYGKRMVLNALSFQVKEGTLVSVLGPNGVGKSTLFKCLLGLNHDYSGVVTINGRNAKSMTTKEMAKLLAYIPQSHQTTFSYSVRDMVMMGTTHQMTSFSVPGKSERQQAWHALEMLDLTDLADRPFTYLSGGEQQLVLIARALAQQAKILLMDEPTSSLDFGNQFRVLETVRQLTQHGYTVLLSCHNPQHAFQFSDQVMALKNGAVEAFGSPEKVITKGLIENLYQMKVRVMDVSGEKFILPDVRERVG
jgi:iron complex transport system ATP-binding protein